MNSTDFGAIHYDIYLDIKLDCTISRIFQEMSLSELETLHQLCELESGKRINFLTMNETSYGFILAPKMYHH